VTDHDRPFPVVGSHARFEALLAGTAVGVYLLVVLGATTAVTGAASACPTWPTCQGAVLETPALAVAWGHRLVAALVGVAVLAVTAVAWTGDAGRRVRAGLAAAALLFPVQVALGGGVALSGAPAVLSALHLSVGVGIFAGLVGALAWTLDDAYGVEEPGDAPTGDPEPAGASAAAVDTTADWTPPEGRLARLRSTAWAYVRLTKPRLMWLLCLVAAAGMALAAATGPALSGRTVVATLLGGVLSIGASGTFNHVLERDVDRRMHRTADRPLATDQVGLRNAVGFGVVLAVASLVAFASVNLVAAALGLTAIVFYSVVYTLVLKPNTVQNTVVGGAAGALPALIGWAAVTGRVGVPGLVLAGVIFLWTPAHFYNLALAYRDDYARGGFPMMPVVRGASTTRRHIVYYLGATLVGAAALAATTDLGAVYAATTVTLGAVFLWAVVRLHRERTDGAAMRSFHAANAYLGALLVAVVVDAVVV
jgi:protoheme IX farnesyltransferase